MYDPDHTHFEFINCRCRMNEYFNQLNDCMTLVHSSDCKESYLIIKYIKKTRTVTDDGQVAELVYTVPLTLRYNSDDRR